MRPGPRNALTDVAGLKVGSAADPAVKTGVTAVTADRSFIAGVAVMGGAPGTRETELLAPDRLVQKVDALILAGGSAYGLAAADGAMAALAATGRGHQAPGARVPIVPTAILFDLANGGDKSWGDNPPYRRLGAEALDAAADEFQVGRAGAGMGATTAGLMGGLGSASLVLPSGAVVGALVAVNALGSAVVPGTNRFWSAPFEMEAEFGGLGAATPESVTDTFATKIDARATGRATTIAVVGTDAALDQAQATRMAWAAHDGMARALAPSHTLFDGDLVFAASTGARALADPVMEPLAIGHAAAICLARAIARGVHAARPMPGDAFPCWRDL